MERMIIENQGLHRRVSTGDERVLYQVEDDEYLCYVDGENVRTAHPAEWMRISEPSFYTVHDGAMTHRIPLK